MRIFTKSLIALAMLVVGVISVSADNKTYLHELTAANGNTADWVDAVPNATTGYPLEVKDNVLFGSDANAQVTNANVGSYDYIYFVVTDFVAERAVRVFFWDPVNSNRIDWYLKPVADKETANYSQPTTVTANGTYCVKIPTGARLQGAKTPWIQTGATDPYFKFSEIYLTETADPLANFKESLTNAIAAGSAQKAIGKTEASFAALQDAISAGQTALAATDATEASLTAAKTAITDAINGLELEEGFTKLTADMFKQYDSAVEPTNPTAVGCSYNFGISDGIAYGNPSVKWFTYADLSEYDNVYVVVASGTARVMFNRAEGDGDGGTYVELTQATDGVITINREDYDYIHLNAIKAPWSQQINVVEVLLYKAPAEEPGEEPGGNPGADMPDMGGTTDDGLIANKLGLNWVIYTANQIELEGMSRDSKKAFETALAEANKVMKTKNATIEQIKAAENNLRNAMKLLEPASAEELSRVYATFENVTCADHATWDAANMNFSWDLGYSNQVHNITLPNGDITQFEYIYVDCDILSGDGYRIMFYAADKGTTAGGTTVINESGLKGFKLSDFEMDPTYLLNNTEFCLSGLNGSGKVHVNAVYFVPGNGTTTAINGISQKSNDSNVIFNLKGQRLSQPAKGINIINGKKVVIK